MTAQRPHGERQSGPTPDLPVWCHAGFANAVTTLGTLAGFTAIYLAGTGRVRLALTALALALLCDRVDGVVARANGTEDAFGRELDSLSDQVTFVVAPPLLALLGHLLPADLWWIVLPYVASGTWRLAHFNVTGLGTDRGRAFYLGQTTTETAAWFVVLTVLSFFLSGWAAVDIRMVWFLIGAGLMTIPVRFMKNGLPARALLVCVPAAIVTMWVLARRW